MADLPSLERSIRRFTLLASGACAVLLLVAAASLAVALRLAWSVRQSAAQLPVVVVPGAIAGVYAPGLNEESLRGAARYLAGLGTNFGGPAGMEQRFDELESFASPRYLPRLQSARAALRRDVLAQGQARVFYPRPGSERLTQSAPGRFDFSQEGERRIFAGGLPMQERTSVVRLSLVQSAPSQKSPLGLALDSFEVQDLGSAPARREPR